VSSAIKKWIVLAGFGWFSVHILISLFFSFSEIPVPPLGRTIIFRYMFPLLNQNFRVFAPDPPFYQSVMEMRFCKDGKAIGNWVNPGAETLKEFQAYRLTPAYTDYRGYEYHLRLLYDAWLLNDYRANKQLNNEIKGFSNETIRDSLLRQEPLMPYVGSYCIQMLRLNQNDVKEIELRIVQIHAPRWENFKQGKTKPGNLVLNFPCISMTSQDY